MDKYHVNLRRLFAYEELSKGVVPVYPLEGHTAFVISPEAAPAGYDEISIVNKPRRVIAVPVTFEGTEQYIGAAIQERLAALIRFAPTSYYHSIEDITLHLNYLKQNNGLRAIVANEPVLDALARIGVPPTVALYRSPLQLASGVAYLIPEPCHMGVIARYNTHSFTLGILAWDQTVAIRLSDVKDPDTGRLPATPRPFQERQEKTPL